jgi:hypothetical protein
VVFVARIWHNFRLHVDHPQEEQRVSQTPAATDSAPAKEADAMASSPAPKPREIGGREGPEPTRFGDWEKAGRCIDF